MRGPGGVDAGAGTVQSSGVQGQARNKKCERFCSPVSFVFSMSRFFLWSPLSTAAGIIHCLSFTWDITMYGPRHHWVRARGPVAFLWRLERSKTAATHIFWEQGNVALDVYAFASPAERSCPFAALNIRMYFVSPPLLSRIIALHASKCERGGSVGFYYDSLNTRTRTAVVMPLSRLLFWIDTMADVKLGLDQMQHNAISLPHTQAMSC